ncbi:MAG: transforming growth factor-beta-induced protein [Planctomycetota bacterium]
MANYFLTKRRPFTIHRESRDDTNGYEANHRNQIGRKVMLKITPVLLALALLVGQAPAQTKDIVDTAVSAGSFNTLAAALTKAGLIDTLKGKGPFTVFAPTDAAFAKVPAATIRSLLLPQNKALLTSILTYHVVPGKLVAADVIKMKGLATVNGQRAALSKAKSQYMIGGAVITATDIMCTNGVIHVIDSVIMPSQKDLVTTAVEAGSFKTLAAALGAADLVAALQSAGPFTVFAPTDAAFAKLPEGTVASLLKPENKKALQEVLTYHVVAGRAFSEAVVKTKSVKTLQGQSIRFSIRNGAAYVNDAKILMTDVNASNGVIHLIDSVILPPKAKPTQTGMQTGMATKLIIKAIDSGAPLYNDGNQAACAAVYQFCGEAILELPRTQINSKIRRLLQSAVRDAKQNHDASERAWIMRRAFDEITSSMDVMNSSSR